MVVYLENMGPLKYKDINLGYITSNDIILEYEDDKFKKRYYNHLQKYSKDIKSAENLVRKVENNFITEKLCKLSLLKNKSAEYKSAQKVLQFEAIKNINILEYIANQEKSSKEFIDYLK